MAHKCQWRFCGAPATKKIHVRLKHPVKVRQDDGKITLVQSEGKDLWRCDRHYEMDSKHWEQMQTEYPDHWIVER